MVANFQRLLKISIFPQNFFKMGAGMGFSDTDFAFFDKNF